MDNQEASTLLQETLASYRALGYEALVRLVDEQDTGELTGSSGARYQFEVSAVHDDSSSGNLRVLASIDDGGLRAVVPLSADFIMAPDGSFVGE